MALNLSEYNDLYLVAIWPADKKLKTCHFYVDLDNGELPHSERYSNQLVETQDAAIVAMMDDSITALSEESERTARTRGVPKRLGQPTTTHFPTLAYLLSR